MMGGSVPEYRQGFSMNAPIKNPQPKAGGPGDAESALESFDWLPCRLSLEVPVATSSVADLLRLQVGCVFATGTQRGESIPLRANGVVVAWIQFETIGTRLVARITELA